MYKSIWKTVGVLLFAVLLTNCSSTKYKIKQESDKIVTEVPQWYMANFDEKKHCDISMWANKPIVKSEDDDKVCIYGVGTSVSPSLELAIEKAKLIAKAEMADIVAGEMNKKAKIFTTELGKNVQKTVVTDVETTLVNIIKNTPVRGYEVWKQEVTLTKNGYYRAWIGIKLPMGEYNKMYNYSVETVVDAFKLKEIAQKAYDEVEIIANEQ